MRKFILIIVFAAFGASLSSAGEIKASDLGGANVVGVLGKRLGVRIMIEGEQDQAGLLANPLKVTTVDGVRLQHSVAIEVRGGITIRKEVNYKLEDYKICKGVHYKLEGYEAGEFSSLPGWLSPWIQQPFQYYPFFIVTKTIEPPMAAKP